MTEDQRQQLVVEALRVLATVGGIGLPPYVVVVSYLTTWWAVLALPPALVVSRLLWQLRGILP